MTSARQRMIHRIQESLGARKLIWVGTRGHDASTLMDISQFSESYAITAPLSAVSIAIDLALEELSGTRVDLDTYKLDEDRSEPALEFRRSLLSSLSEPAVVVAYRPFALLSALCYPRADFLTYLGMFHERHATFEHKPWVESELRKLAIPVISWRYFATEDRLQLEEYVAAHRNVVVRTNRSDGGAGLGVIRSRRQALQHIPQAPDGFFAAAPLLQPNIPVNIGACIFQDGSISLHPPSFQLIGIDKLTCRSFGYCGNDFAAISTLTRSEIESLESLTLQAGKWLHSQGYLGAFGLDALLHEGSILLTEINPRFQGSTLLSTRIDKKLDRPDIMLCHLAAYLGQAAPPSVALTDLVEHQEKWSQLILHNSLSEAVTPCWPLRYSEEFNVELAATEGVSILPNGVLFRIAIRQAVTCNGHAIEPEVMRRLAKLLPTEEHLRAGGATTSPSIVNMED